MKVVVVGYSITRGGAAIAAGKLARVLAVAANVTCVTCDSYAPPGLELERPGPASRLWHLFFRCAEWALLLAMWDRNPVKHSLNLFSSAYVRHRVRVHGAEGAIINVHWVNNDTLSLRELERLPAGSVITLHDEWLFCGAEHYADVFCGDRRFIEGYPASDERIKGLNWNRIVWRRKMRWLSRRNDLIFTVPSCWMLQRARWSAVLRNRDVRLLPNPIDVETFRPAATGERRRLRRNMFGIKDREVVVAIGAVKGHRNPLKGFRVFGESLKVVARERASNEDLLRVRLLVFGGDSAGRSEMEGFPVLNVGAVRGAEAMRNLYCSADVVVVPSLVESFGQVAAESLACETPVVAFGCSGLLDIVQDGVNGYLAEPFDHESLAECIGRMVALPEEARQELGRAGRQWVSENFGQEAVLAKYMAILKDAQRKGVQGGLGFASGD